MDIQASQRGITGILGNIGSIGIFRRNLPRRKGSLPAVLLSLVEERKEQKSPEAEEALLEENTVCFGRFGRLLEEERGGGAKRFRVLLTLYVVVKKGAAVI